MNRREAIDNYLLKWPFTLTANVDFDGMEISEGVFLIGDPTPIPGTTKMRSLANVHGALALIELSIRFAEKREHHEHRQREACNMDCVPHTAPDRLLGRCSASFASNDRVAKHDCA
jgi:hypothetical protein